MPQNAGVRCPASQSNSRVIATTSWVLLQSLGELHASAKSQVNPPLSDEGQPLSTHAAYCGYRVRRYLASVTSPRCVASRVGSLRIAS